MATKLKQASIAIRQNKGRDFSPAWEGADSWTGQEFTSAFHKAMAWYRLEKSIKDLKPKLIEWMHSAGYKKADIDSVRRIKDKYFNGTLVAVAACLVKGMPDVHPGFNKGRSTSAWLRSALQEVIARGSNDLEDDEDAPVVKEVKPVVAVPNIQERLKEAAGAMSEELDAAIDAWITDPDTFDPKAFKVLNLLRGKGVKAAHARHIKSFFSFGHNELLELASGEADEQLREAYRHNSRKNVKKLIEFYESIMSACDQIAAEQKVMKKPRQAKVKPAEQLVAKLKFMVKDDKLGIVSVPPAQLIGAAGAVVYNAKSRKIGYYIAKSTAGLSVKGTSLLDFTEKSTQKTLRKPAEQIKEFKEQNTQKRFETWYNKGVKTTETQLNGRFNEDTVILKVWK